MRGFRELPLQDCGPLLCPVSSFGFGDSLSTHPRSSNFYQPNMTLATTSGTAGQEATDVQALKRLGKHPSFVPIFGHMKVVQWEAQPEGLHEPARKDKVQSSSSRFVARNPYHRRPSSIYASSHPENPDRPTPGLVLLMYSSHTSPSGDRTDQ